jgi:hypothetical protein
VEHPSMYSGPLSSNSARPRRERLTLPALNGRGSRRDR